MKIKVQNGTPHNPKSMCRRCTNSVIVKGAAESQEAVFCKAISYNQPACVPFEVIECNCFIEIGKPSLYDMQRIAWIVTTDKKGGKLGFIPAAKFKEENKLEDFNDICPAP